MLCLKDGQEKNKKLLTKQEDYGNLNKLSRRKTLTVGRGVLRCGETFARPMRCFFSSLYLDK